MNSLQIIIIYLSVLLLIIITAIIIANILKPIIRDTKSEYDEFDKYINAVYNSSLPDGIIVYEHDLNSSHEHSNKNINILNTLKYFNFIYDNASRDILDLYPVAENLSFSWPPKMGYRYKLTAFPYPQSNNTLLAVYSTISNTVDAYTFPGWSIQRRNPLDFNNSIYNKGFFRPYQYIEILHACYPPPGVEYPLCDDGGWWLYYAGGSGVFWNTGKCFISNNKLSCLYDLYKCSIKKIHEIEKINSLLPDAQKKPLPPIIGYSISDITKKFEGKGGGNSIMVAIFSIVSSLNKHSTPPHIVGFKNLASSESGGSAWTRFIVLTFFILYLIVILIILYFKNIRGKSWKIIIVLSFVFLILLVSIIYYFLFIVFEDFFRGLGWVTLDMALEKTGMSLYQFVSECVTGNLKNPTCNSLSMVQLFDLDLEGFTWAMNYDSFILTSQPNKTGTWEVEICDLRRYDPKKKGIATDGGVCNTLNISKNNHIYQSGLEGRFDSCSDTILPKLNPNSNNYQLMTGPLTYDITGPPFYKPTNKSCDCVEASNRLCTSCKNTLSEKLCIK